MYLVRIPLLGLEFLRGCKPSVTKAVGNACCTTEKTVDFHLVELILAQSPRLNCRVHFKCQNPELKAQSCLHAVCKLLVPTPAHTWLATVGNGVTHWSLNLGLRHDQSQLSASATVGIKYRQSTTNARRSPHLKMSPWARPEQHSEQCERRTAEVACGPQQAVAGIGAMCGMCIYGYRISDQRLLAAPQCLPARTASALDSAQAGEAKALTALARRTTACLFGRPSVLVLARGLQGANLVAESILAFIRAIVRLASARALPYAKKPWRRGRRRST